jgi:hypothetical protein
MKPSGVTLDRDGTEVTGDSPVREHATAVARELMRNCEAQTRLQHLQVCDAEHKLCFEVPCVTRRAPACRSRRRMLHKVVGESFMREDNAHRRVGAVVRTYRGSADEVGHALGSKSPASVLFSRCTLRISVHPFLLGRSTQPFISAPPASPLVRHPATTAWGRPIGRMPAIGWGARTAPNAPCAVS